MPNRPAHSKVLGLALVAWVATGCPPEQQCAQSTTPQTTPVNGIDPRQALDAIKPTAVPLRWVQLDQSTLFTITALAAPDQAIIAHTDCSSKVPLRYEVPATVTLETADGRLHSTASATELIRVSAAGNVVLPQQLSVEVAASTLIGTGVLSDTLLSTAPGPVEISVQLVEGIAEIACGEGTIVLTGRDRIRLADINGAP